MDNSGVARKDSRIIWSAIVVQQVMNYTLSPLHFENVKSSEIISFHWHINLLQCYASHRVKQNSYLALAVIIFCLTIFACDVSLVFSMHVTSVLDMYSFALTKNIKLS